MIPNGNYLPVLAPYDLTRGGTEYYYFGHTDVKELALYVEDQIKAGNWLFNLGMRGDLYNGLADSTPGGAARGHRLQPQAHEHRPARLLRAHSGDAVQRKPGAVEPGLLQRGACAAAGLLVDRNWAVVSKTLEPGFRNEFHAGLQQAFGKHAVVSGEYIWKYTHNAFDFSVLGNTPITFPIDWHNSKIPGFALRAEVPETSTASARIVVMSSVAARFFPPQVAGAGATSGVAVGYPFRIDHDERFNETTHLQYSASRRQVHRAAVDRLQLALSTRGWWPDRRPATT